MPKDISILSNEIVNGCKTVGIPDYLINKLNERLYFTCSCPWTIKQQTGSCGFTSILMAMFYLYEPKNLTHLFKQVFNTQISRRLWDRYQLFFGDSYNHDYMLDYFLTVGMMLIFKDKGTKFQSTNPHHKRMWLDCIEYSKPFCQWELNPYNSKLKNLIKNKKTIDKNRLSFKKGDLALVINGLLYESDSWLKHDVIHYETIMASPEYVPPITPITGYTLLCEIVGVGPASISIATDKNMYKATVKWHNIYHWVFRPRWERMVSPDKGQNEIWSWGSVYESVNALGKDYSEKASIRIYTKVNPSTVKPFADKYSKLNFKPLNHSLSTGKYI